MRLIKLLQSHCSFSKKNRVLKNSSNYNNSKRKILKCQINTRYKTSYSLSSQELKLPPIEVLLNKQVAVAKMQVDNYKKVVSNNKIYQSQTY